MASTNEKILAGVLIAVVVVAAVAIGVIVVSRQISSHGTVVSTSYGLGVYTDAACTDPLTEIDWGKVSNGAVATTPVFYVKNTGQNTNLTLGFNVTDWNPTGAANYFTLTWNYTGAVLQPGEVLAVQMQLTIAQSVPFTAFSNRININGVSA
ncbi:MAG: hypothetical protein ACQCN6_01770 [Candidatus Bathyarchaeia archaeon]|jgi:archaellum component FlaG (FlaF/FlaG flagellin family)